MATREDELEFSIQRLCEEHGPRDVLLAVAGFVAGNASSFVDNAYAEIDAEERRADPDVEEIERQKDRIEDLDVVDKIADKLREFAVSGEFSMFDGYWG
jgi:hypothetical protein